MQHAPLTANDLSVPTFAMPGLRARDDSDHDAFYALVQDRALPSIAGMASSLVGFDRIQGPFQISLAFKTGAIRDVIVHILAGVFIEFLAKSLGHQDFTLCSRRRTLRRYLTEAYLKHRFVALNPDEVVSD